MLLDARIPMIPSSPLEALWRPLEATVAAICNVSDDAKFSSGGPLGASGGHSRVQANNVTMFKGYDCLPGADRGRGGEAMTIKPYQQGGPRDGNEAATSDNEPTAAKR